MLNLESNTNTGGLSPGVQAFLGQYNTLKPEDRALVEGKLQEIMAQTNALPAFISPSANSSGVEDQVPKRFPSATNGHTALPDGSPMKVDDMSLPASPAVDEELPDYDDFTSESRLSNSPRLEDRSSMEIETDIVFTQVCGALLPTLLDEGGVPFLRRIRPALKKLATGDFEYPTWMPEDAANMPADVREHFTALKIPRLHGSRTPCLLLHDLGSNSDQEVGNLAKMLSTFVDKVHHKCFVNCSGSGKTRLCLESLCLEYGLYFTCATPGFTADGDDLGGLAPQIGSRDLASVNDILINHESFTQNLRHASVQDPGQAGRTNSALAHSYLVSVLVARLVILLEYLGCHSTEQLHSANSKRAWMYLQVQPFLDDDIPDVFDKFARHVLPQHPEAQDPQAKVNPVSAVCKQIALMLGRPDNLFSFPIVIDEAQLGAVALGDAFLSSTSTQNEVNTRPILQVNTRPILREIVFSFATISVSNNAKKRDRFDAGSQRRESPQDYEPHLIITGSGLSREIVLTAISSFVGKTKVVETVGDTGAFVHQEKQRRYLRKYFPSGWLDHDDGEILQHRAWIWLRGRHRFTASFIQYTLRHWQHAALHANVLLNMFVAGLSGNFEPWDALKYHMNLDTVPKPNDWNIVAQLNKLPNSFMVFIRAELYEYFLHSKRPTPINNATEQFIQSGIGLVHVEASNKIKIIISEPLICLTLFTIVNEPYAKTTPGKPAEMQAPLYEHLVQHIQQTSSDVNRFEDLLAYYFSLAFEEPRALQEVFNITSDGNHALGSYCAQLVTSTRVLPASDGGAIEVEGVHRFASLHRPTSSGTDQPRYAGPLGYRAVDDSTQKVWGTHLFQAHSLDSPAPILFPGHHMGPDLLFLLRLYPPINPSKISYLWVAVQAKLCHVRDQTQVPIATVRSAIRSVTPKNFFMTKDGEWCSGFEPHSKTMKGLEDGLPGPPTFGTGRYHLLRVLCGYPAVVGPLDPADILDDGKHPIATLNVDQFIHITKDHPPEDTLSFYQDEYQATKARAIFQKKENSRAAGIAGRKSKTKAPKLVAAKAAARKGTSTNKGHPGAVPSQGSRPRQTRNSTKTPLL